MNVTSILAELKSERTRIGQAISAINSLDSTNHYAVRTSTPKRRRGHMSAAARRKLSMLLKQRWAQGKMGKKASAKSARTSKPTHRISGAGRKRIAEATKRRWAEWRKKAKAA